MRVDRNDNSQQKDQSTNPYPSLWWGQQKKYDQTDDTAKAALALGIRSQLQRHLVNWSRDHWIKNVLYPTTKQIHDTWARCDPESEKLRMRISAFLLTWSKANWIPQCHITACSHISYRRSMPSEWILESGNSGSLIHSGEARIEKCINGKDH